MIRKLVIYTSLGLLAVLALSLDRALYAARKDCGNGRFLSAYFSA